MNNQNSDKNEKAIAVISQNKSGIVTHVYSQKDYTGVPEIWLAEAEKKLKGGKFEGAEAKLKEFLISKGAKVGKTTTDQYNCRIEIEIPVIKK